MSLTFKVRKSTFFGFEIFCWDDGLKRYGKPPSNAELPNSYKEKPNFLFKNTKSFVNRFSGEFLRLRRTLIILRFRKKPKIRKKEQQQNRAGFGMRDFRKSCIWFQSIVSSQDKGVIVKIIPSSLNTNYQHLMINQLSSLCDNLKSRRQHTSFLLFEASFTSLKPVILHLFKYQHGWKQEKSKAFDSVTLTPTCLSATPQIAHHHSVISIQSNIEPVIAHVPLMIAHKIYTMHFNYIVLSQSDYPQSCHQVQRCNDKLILMITKLKQRLTFGDERELFQFLVNYQLQLSSFVLFFPEMLQKRNQQSLPFQNPSKSKVYSMWSGSNIQLLLYTNLCERLFSPISRTTRSISSMTMQSISSKHSELPQIKFAFILYSLGPYRSQKMLYQENCYITSQLSLNKNQIYS